MSYAQNFNTWAFESLKYEQYTVKIMVTLYFTVYMLRVHTIIITIHLITCNQLLTKPSF